MASLLGSVTRHVIGFDFGTSGLRASLYDESWRRLASSQVSYPLSLPRPGWAEQNPADWWDAMGRASRALLADSGIRPDSVQAIGLCSQMCGCIAVDADANPLHPCLIWLDTRSTPEAQALTAGGPRVAGYGAWRLARWLWLTNGAPNLSGKDPTSKMVWLASRPALAGRIARFLDVKDWLVLRCTGEATTSKDAAQLTWMMDTRDGRHGWSPSLMRHVGVDPAQLPAIVESGARAGSLRADAAAHLGLSAGITVAGGSGDMNAYALASGGRQPGQWHLHVGTSAWLGSQSPRRRVDPLTGIATLCSAIPGHHLLVATQDSAGSGVAWAARQLGFGEGAAGLATLDTLAAQCQPTANTPMFLPWMHGERVPVDDPALRGGLVGLSLSTTRADIAHALLAGVALNARWAWTHARRLVRDVSGPLRMLGGATHSAIWPSIFADVLQHPVAVVADAQWGGSRGAAMMASVACGWHEDLRAPMDLVQMGKVHDPDRSRAAWAADQFGLFTDFHKASHRWFGRRLGAMQPDQGDSN